MIQRFALRYSETALAGLTFNSEAANQTIYDGVEFKPVEVERETARGECLSGRLYESRLHKRKVHSFKISANEFDAAFLTAWYDAPYRYLSRRNGAAWADYALVMPDDGARLPISYIDNLADLPETTIICKEVMPS